MKHETVLTIEDEIKITEAWCNGNRTASDLISETERFILTKQAEKAQPVDMVLYCPKCGMQHIDAPDERTPDWGNPPHKSHLCHGCGHIWRPSDTPTNGVARTASGKDADTAPLTPSALLEAAEKALEALGSCTNGDYSTGHMVSPSFDEKLVIEAETALRAAIEAHKKGQV